MEPPRCGLIHRSTPPAHSSQYYIMSNQIFQNLLKRVGDQHNYQWIVTVTISVISAQIAMSAFLQPYAFYQEDYSCPASVLNCQEYVCSLPKQDRSTYVTSSTQMLIDRFGDYRCQPSVTQNAQVVIYIGGLFGVIIALILASFITERQLLIETLFGNLVGLAITLFSWNLTMATVGLTINFAHRFMQVGSIFTFLSQNTGETIRVQRLIFLYLGLTLGAVVITLAYWLVHPWEINIIVLQIIPLMGCIISLTCCVEQTPAALIASKNTKDAFTAFQNISRINGVTLDITQQQIAAIQEEYIKNQRQKHDIKLSFIDLIRYKSLRSTTILLFIFRLTLNYCWMGMGLNLSSYALTFFPSGVLITSSQLLPMIVATFTLAGIPRKYGLMVMTVLCLGISLLLWLVVPCIDRSQCSLTQVFFQAILLFLYRIINIFADSLHIVHLTELFPAQVKGIVGQLMCIASCLSFLLIPPIKNLVESHHESIFISFAVANLISFACMVGVEETIGTTPPDMIFELQYQSQVRSQL